MVSGYSGAKEVREELRVRGSNIRGVVNARRVYSAIVYLHNNATIENLLQYTEMKRSTLYYTLKKLVEKGFVRRERVGRRVVYRVAKPLNIAEIVDEIGRVRDDVVYKIARVIRRLMEAYSIDGDLIGSSKIHIETYPLHLAVFPVIEAVVAREHFVGFANMLVDYLDAFPSYSDNHRIIVLSPRNIPGGVRVLLHCDGFVENGRILWNLRKYLKREKGLTLEHAAVINLIKSYWSRNDRDDMYIAMRFVNLPRLLDLLRDAVESKPWLIPRVRDHLRTLVKFAKENFPDTEDAVKTVAEKISRFLDSIEAGLKAKQYISEVG